jgi:hypothetical protein
MVLGGLALLLFWAMRWRWGPDYTMLLVAISVTLVFAAMVQLLLFGFREWRYQGPTQGGLRVRFSLGILLLLCNVPVLALYTLAPQRMTRQTTLTVNNTGPVTIDRFVVENSGVKTDIGPIAPGATVKANFDVTMNSWLSFEAWQTRGSSRSMSGGSLERGHRTVTMTTAGMTIK